MGEPDPILSSPEEYEKALEEVSALSYAERLSQRDQHDLADCLWRLTAIEYYSRRKLKDLNLNPEHYEAPSDVFSTSQTRESEKRKEWRAHLLLSALDHCLDARREVELDNPYAALSHALSAGQLYLADVAEMGNKSALGRPSLIDHKNLIAEAKEIKSRRPDLSIKAIATILHEKRGRPGCEQIRKVIAPHLN